MLVTLRSYIDQAEAHLAVGLLEEHGIPAYLADEHMIMLDTLQEGALGGIKVQVLPDLAEEADAVLREHLPGEQRTRPAGPSSAGTDPELSCPQCDSTHWVSYRPWMWLCLLLPILILFAHRKKNVCLDCRHTWRPTPP